MKIRTDRSRLTRLVGAATVMAVTVALMALSPAKHVHADPYVTFYSPDLRVTSSEVKWVDNWFFAPGYYLVFTVKNGGAGNAGAFSIAVRTNQGATLQTFALNGLEAGGSRTYPHMLPDPGHCNSIAVNRTIVLDSTKKVAEYNEFNNVVVSTGPYGPGPC
jgi:hypothetical protein